ncbi:MAG: bacillithiol system redox-active protein YtxJ [Cyclobacteriaceae bacterium]|nr:bacillithiol system redox-active protein YtxJ [Cyclobacteriaceae bacterium]
MNWIELIHTEQVSTLLEESTRNPVIIFKHSIRCSISKAALDRLERHWNNDEMAVVKPYYLDLISYRSLSDEIARFFDIEHESPQIIVIKNKKAIYDSSHMAINYTAIKDILND